MELIEGRIDLKERVKHPLLRETPSMLIVLSRERDAHNILQLVLFKTDALASHSCYHQTKGALIINT